ncbi:EAL domain-containing protein [Neorhizobium galegae]|uniref:EAL domain-containing protein n=1 Tax=Neorhizobium galegae TaxID=399 RepID=UPI000621D380|nr:EAL domain-containing protein [Neorhizobium galegae]CDZ61223.1 Diguanylate cyclase/phosphodiesterase with PAS/PAC sensor(S) [Neorhizobium galegae bv. orientalis]KAB1124596.1 EAL domain-containing protein [Neorhizobium galegae]MCQ1810450.1 EAL domain-containing protein [Neorhizobium galegae]MCQ1836145.1 EAL domain-containing protein [Neorhizobium galegae]UIK03854.1 EAL domain-containing protein [Neorhizobium galegae]
MTHSVESRFIAIISGALLVVVAPLFTLFLALSSQQAAKNLSEHVNVVLVTNSQALGKPLWDLDTDSIHQVASMLVADPAINGVQISDNTGKLNISEVDVNPADFRGLEAISEPIFYKSQQGTRNVGSITVYVPKLGWFSALHQMEMAFISIFIITILTVFGAAILGNRVMVIKPLMRLTAAIEATRRLGSRHHVDWRSNDEMGRLAKSFNEMQTLLEREERELKRAHQQTTEIYNLTPAMLFSLTSGDQIAAVSDYWLLATGYRRDDVIGHPFSELVAPADRQIYARRKQQAKLTGLAIEATVRFLCADGRLMDVLIVEIELGMAAGSIPGSLSVMTDVTELRQSELRNRQQAISDHLTGLLNRQGFEATLDQKIAEADKARTEVACLFVDLDRFKAINDNLGHAAGDAVLCQFVERTKPMLQDTDTASRLGGDEFAILITGDGAERRATELSQKIVDMFEVPFRIQGTGVRLSASIGLAFYPSHATSAAELLQKSDMAMYARKRDGKNGAQVYDPAILDQTRERAEIESDIEVAIAASWFEAHFQPIVDIETGIPSGFEALMRMRHPRKGLMSPAGIICVAEETGSIGQIGNLILEDAMANLARVSRLPGMGETYVAVNFSPLQFEPGLPARLAGLLGRYGIDPSRFVVEITEAVLMHDNPEIRTILNEIHRFGCRIALDDFGTGYSSLSYMSRFPVDIVKIDQSFIRSLTEQTGDIGSKNRMLVEGISAISHKMNCKVVAEGVETEEQRLLLQQMGIDYAQGYLFSKPREISELLSALSARQAEIESMAS